MSVSPVSPGPSRRPSRRVVGGILALGAIAAAGVALLVGRTDRGSQERGEALRAARAGQFADAEPNLRKALDRNPRDLEVAEALARGSTAAESDRAEADLNRWVELQLDSIEALRMRMEYHRKRKDYEKALVDGRRIRAQDSQSHDDAAFRRTVMNLAFSAGQFEEAEVLCREGLRAQPNETPLRSMLSQIRRARNDAAGAAAILDDLLKEQPKLTSAMMARAILYEEMGEPEKAIPLLRELLQIDPSRQRPAGYMLSLALERTGQTEEAKKVMAEVRRRQDVEVFSEAIKSQPDNLELQVRLASSLLADGHTTDGLALMQSVLDRDRTFPAAHSALADHYEKQGDPTRAAEHRRQAGSP